MLIAFGAEVKVDFLAEKGPVRPVNGVGQPPLVGAPRHHPMFHYLTEAGIPCSRLHDVGWPYGRGVYVDIPNLFRNFDADETKAESYDHDRCAREFLAAVRDRKCPLDFFSYHSYASVADIAVQIEYAQKLLEEYGFGSVETRLDEWLPRPNRRHARAGEAPCRGVRPFDGRRRDLQTVMELGTMGLSVV